MLSRVADSLYWMSRYFERADHCSRVLEANYILLLNPSKPSREARWNRITEALGLKPESLSGDSQATIMRLIAQPGNRSSIVSSIAGARENASQVREQISSEMWESLNQLYHKVTAASSSADGSRSVPAAHFVSRGGVPVLWCKRFNHEPWRRLAFHSTRQVYGARLRAVAACSMPTSRRRRARTISIGSAYSQAALQSRRIEK